MPRPRVATAVLDARGAFANHPERRRKNEPQPTGDIGDPPKHLSASAKACWRELTSYAPPGVMFNSDRVSLELCCVLLAEFREDAQAMQGVRLSKLVNLLSMFGMTPSDRAKLQVEKPKPANAWEEF